MLKIKENVDLKELEKFGFEQYVSDGWAAGTRKDFAEVLVDSREIGINITSGFYRLVFQELDVIFDLIKADLVEKV